jgi:hypothetical protein
VTGAALDKDHLIEALAGPDNWGIETTSDDDRIVWVRLGLPRREIRGHGG